MADNLQTWPADIYLVAGDRPLLPYRDIIEVSWCSDKIGDADVRYIRHDLVDQQLNDLHRSIAGAVQHAEAGWARYEAANADRNAVRAERVQMVARIAELEADIAWQRSVTDAARQTQADLLERADRLEALLPYVAADTTAHLLATPANAARLEQSIAQLAALRKEDDKHTPSTIINLDLIETRAAAVADPSNWPAAADISYKTAIMPDQATLMAAMSPAVVLEIIRRLRQAEKLEYTETMHLAATNAAMAGGLMPDPDQSVDASVEKFIPIADVIIAVLKAARAGFGGGHAHS